MDNQSKIILIAGPTASGKSNFAVKLAKKIDGEIINADSMQVYRQLKILTARPNKKTQKNIKHHLYGIVNINRKIIIEQKPSRPMFPSEIAHGKRKAISKSKMINNIATK